MSRKSISIDFAILFTLLLLASCNSNYTSKKKGYFKIDFPEHSYRLFDQPGYPFRFEYPIYADMLQDSTYFDSTPENPYWINMDFKTFNARIFFSYKKIGGKATYKVRSSDGSYRDSVGVNNFDKLVEDAYTLTSKNDFIATSKRDSLYVNPHHVTGVIFKVGGNAATAIQFFMTDTVQHFLRGALYFEVTPNADSLRPVVDFLGADIRHLINTFEWKN